MSMTQMKNWQAIYALTLILIVGSAWAEEKKPSAAKATCPKCCAATQAAPCKESCKETCSSCSSPNSSKLVTRIHSLAPFFEALEQLEEEENAVSGPPAYAARSGKAKLEEQIVKLITNHIQPASWNHMGGLGTVDYFALGKALVVTQKAETHEQIARFLDDLRSLVDDVMAADEEEQEQCLPPRAFAGMPMLSYYPAPVDLPIERIMIERVMAQPAYPYPPAQCVYPCPPMPFPPMTAPPAPPMMDALQARMPAPEVLPAPRPVTMPVSVAQCTAMQPAQCQGFGCVMRAKCEGGKTQLEMENCCMGMRAVCESMEMKISGADSFKLTAQQSQIHIEGHGFRAMADCLKCTGGSDWMLEGHVMLSYKKDGASAQVRGDRVVLSLKEGQMEFKFAGNSPAMPSPIHPATYSAPLDRPTGEWVP
jgi:hypothetical protein